MSLGLLGSFFSYFKQPNGRDAQHTGNSTPVKAQPAFADAAEEEMCAVMDAGTFNFLTVSTNPPAVLSNPKVLERDGFDLFLLDPKDNVVSFCLKCFLPPSSTLERTCFI
jgi:hypothetical protein